MLDLAKCFTHSRDLGFITDPRGTILAITAGTERALGYAREELVGLDLARFDEAGDLRGFFELTPVRSRMNLGFHLKTKSGDVLTVGALATSLRDESGSPVGWFLAGQDLKGALGEARGDRPILDALVDSIGAALWSFDRNGTIITWSRACEGAFGIPRADAEGKLPAVRLFPSAADYRRVVEEVDRAGQFSGELALLGGDGAPRPSQVTVTPLVSGGLSVGYTCASFDLSERRRAEEFQRVLFEQAGEAILVVDPATRNVVDANERAAEMHGYAREEFLRLGIPDLLIPEAHPRMEAIGRSLREAGRYDGQQFHRRKDGSVFPCRINLRTVAAGGRRLVIAVYHDLTEELKAQEFFRVLFEKAGDPVYLVADDDLQIVQANEAACRLLGYTREEMLRLKVVDLVPPPYRNRIAEYHASVRSGPGYRRDRRVLYRKDGTIVATDQTVSRVEIAGKPYYIATNRDLTEQERAARELEEAKAFLEHMQENASDGLALLDESGVYVAVNRVLCEWRGERREEILGQPWMKNTPPERMGEYKHFWDLLMKGERITMRTQIEKPGAPPVVVDVSSAMILRGDRKYVFAICRDVTAQVKSEAELRKSREDLERHVAERTAQLRESEERFRGAFAQGGIGMALVAPDGRFIQVNRSLCEMLGYSEAELLAVTFHEITHPEDRAQSGDLARGMLAGGIASARFEKRYFHRQGHVVWADLASTVIRDAAGKPLYFVTSIQDITERKRAQEELERRVEHRTAELGRANALLQEEISERKRAENALRLILQGTAAVTGGSFFRSLVRHLASALDVKVAAVVQGLGQPPTRARTIAFWNGADFAEPVEYDLADTPCESVLAGETCCYSHDLQRLFPHLKMLADLGAESYLGVPMLDSAGAVVGHLWVMDVRPVADEELKLSVMKIFAARAGVELERQLAEEALRRSEERWRSLVANAPDFILTVDRQGRILSINRTIGMTMEEALGRRVHEFVSPDVVPHVEEALRKAFEEGKSSSYETQSLGPNGGTAWYITRVGAVKVEGQVVMATFIATDITERWTGEQRQKAQHDVTGILAEAPSMEAAAPRLLRAICEGLDWQLGFLWRVDPAANALRLVDAWHAPQAPFGEFVRVSRTLSFAPGQGLVGAAWKDAKPIWTPDVQQDPRFQRGELSRGCGLQAQLILPLEGPRGMFGVIEFLSADKRPRDEPLLQLAATLGSQIGQFIERKRAEEDLRFQKSLLESQSEAAIDGILVVSRNGMMTSFNRRFCQMWDIPDDVIRMRNDDRALQSVLDKLVDPSEFLARVRHLYDHPNEESRDEIQLKDGRTFDRYSAPVKGAGGMHYGRVWYFRDITGRKRTEENLRRAAEETRQMYEDLKEAQAQLIRSEKLASIGMLVSGVAHEINNPLNVMYGNLQLLAEVSDVLLPLSLEGARAKKVRGTASRVAKFRGMIRDALKAARHAREIVHDFRNFARDTRTAELVDLNECLEEAVTLMQRELRPGIRVVRKLGRIPQVRCMRGQISQVFLNLLKNAGEAIEKKGTVTLRTRRKDGHVLVDVSDTGRGMAEDVRRKLFEPFFTTKPVGKGLGLGLSISAMIVQNHNGRISVSSTPGRGSLFRVELPCLS